MWIVFVVVFHLHLHLCSSLTCLLVQCFSKCTPHFQTERLTFLRNVCINLPERETALCNAPVEHVGGFSLPFLPSHAHGQSDGSLFSNGFEFVTLEAAAAATALVYIFTWWKQCGSRDTDGVTKVLKAQC